MATKIGIYKGSFIDGYEDFQIPAVNVKLPLVLTVISQGGYGLLLTLKDPMDTVVWQESLEGSSMAEIVEESSNVGT